MNFELKSQDRVDELRIPVFRYSLPTSVTLEAYRKEPDVWAQIIGNQLIRQMERNGWQQAPNDKMEFYNDLEQFMDGRKKPGDYVTVIATGRFFKLPKRP